jgi:hypothetical protein
LDEGNGQKNGGQKNDEEEAFKKLKSTHRADTRGRYVSLSLHFSVPHFSVRVCAAERIISGLAW